jgi:plasmid stabilization system protein ParE
VNLRFRNAAESDVGDAYSWYRERGHDLGDQFLQALDQCLESVQRNPLAFAKVHGDVRRALLRRFPYGVFYIVTAEEIVVLGCLHGHRDPTIWQDRRDA